MLFEQFHFLRPSWLFALIPLLALGWWWLKRTQSGSGWEFAIDNELLAVLLDAKPARGHYWVSRLLLASLVAGCFGLAGPVWEKLPQNVEQKNDALVIVLDLSLSMLAQDLKPSRIERARQEIADVLRTRDEGQTAIVAYAGDAHAVVPLTDDTGTISNLLVALSPDMMPVFGSNPDHALTVARELFDNANILQGRILLITDGIDAINSVSKHRSAAYPISILGIGTYDGAAIPLDRVRQPGRFLRTQEGNQIIATLDEERLSDVAALTFGNYAKAVVGDSDISHLLSTPLPGDDETIEVEREFDTWFDQGHWVVLLLVPAMLLAFRKGVLVCLCIAIFLPAPPAHAEGIGDDVANLWDGLWQRDDQRGRKALLYGEPEEAAALFNDPQWRSVAEYRSGSYAQALNGFSTNDSITGAYNQANSLARLGELDAAIALYDEILVSDPNHEDADFNKELVERMQKEQQESQSEQQDEQNPGNNEDSESEQEQSDQEQESEPEEESESDQEQEQDSEQQSEQEEQQGEQQQAEESDKERDEKQEALEQWLRRVPDDPGGLLRRKFSHETKQRLRRGDYSNRQTEKVW